MIKRSLLWVLAAYCIGIVFRDRLKWILWAVLFSCVCFGYVIFRKRYVRRDFNAETLFLIMLLSVLLLGAVLGRLQAADYPIDTILKEKTVASAEGRIRSIAETKSGYQLELNHISITLAVPKGEQWQEIEYTKGKLLVYCETIEALKIGNYVRLEGKAVPFAEPENAGQFDERAYYRAERMCCKFSAEKIIVLNDGVDGIRECCRAIRNRLDSIYEEILPKKHAGIVSAILLGDKAELDEDTKDLYQKNGIAHILAISGLHVSLLGMGLFALIRKCGSPLIPASVATMLILIFYGCLTEFSVSTQRAVGMLVIAMLAKILGRSYDSRSACALCGLIILIANPLQLYQAGFQLSFAAALGISYFGRELEQMKLNKGTTSSEKMIVALLSGLTTQLLTVPIILNCFYELPVYAVFLNLPVIGLLSAMVFLSIFAGFAGIFSYSLGRFFAGGVFIILEFYEALCKLVDRLPCPVWLYGKPQSWRIAVYWIVLVLFFVVAKKLGKKYQHHPDQHRYRRQAFLILCLLPLAFVRRENGSICVDFIAVGQGDCAVVRSGNGSTYLIDCGSSTVKSVGEYRIKPWLKYHGVAELEAVFLSHPDSDHTNGIIELLEKNNSPDDWYRGEIQIKNLVLPEAYRAEVEVAVAEKKRMRGATENDFVQSGMNEAKGFIALYEMAQERDITVLWLDTGDKVMEDKLSFTCLHPGERYPTYDTNDASMVLLLECQDIMVLFTGDVGVGGEEKVGLALRETFATMGRREERSSERGVVVCEGNSGEERNKNNGSVTVILKVAHHGSRNSTSEKFLETIQPDIAVISCGRENRFGHPHEETMERLRAVGSKVVTTPEYGTVTIRISKEETVVTGYSQQVKSE